MYDTTDIFGSRACGLRLFSFMDGSADSMMGLQGTSQAFFTLGNA